MKKSRNFIHLFDRKKSRIDSRIRRDYIENGIATIHCQISSYNDIISTYSVKDQESLNFDFIDYLQDIVSPIPDEFPIVLNIIGNCLTDEEKKLSLKILVMNFFINSVYLKRNKNANLKCSYLCLSAQSLQEFYWR